MMVEKPVIHNPGDLEAEEGVDDHFQDSHGTQDRLPLFPSDTREITPLTHPFYKVAFSFLALVVLHVLLALSFKLAQKGSKAEYAFSSAALLVVAELSKLVISFSLLWQEACCTKPSDATDDETPTRATAAGSICGTLERLRAEISYPLLRKTAVLAALYFVNNNIAFFVFRLADGANINLIKSGSSFVSALMLRFSLGRSISRVQWSAILLQIFGLIVAQFGATCTDRPLLSGYAYTLLFISLLISSVCGVWNDHILKHGSHKTSMHTINILLYAFGFMFNGATYISIADPSKHFFSGFQKGSTYTVLLCQSLFGVAVSAVYKFSDATVKTFALSCATSILMFINIFAFGARFSLVATMGCLTVFVATHLYISNPPDLKRLVSSKSVLGTLAASGARNSEGRRQPRKEPATQSFWEGRRNPNIKKLMATGNVFLFVTLVSFLYWTARFEVGRTTLPHAELVAHAPRFSRHCLLMAGSIRDMASYTHLISQTWIAATPPDIYAVVMPEVRSDEVNERKQRSDGMLPWEAAAVEQLRSLEATKNVLVLNSSTSLKEGELEPDLAALLPSFPFPTAPRGIGFGSAQGCIHQWSKWVQVWELMENTTGPWNHRYDFIVKIRPDINYFPELATVDLDAASRAVLNNGTKIERYCPGNGTPIKDPDTDATPGQMHRLFTPQCCSWGGFNDMLFWGPYQTMRYAMNTLYRIEEWLGGNQTAHMFHAETTFKMVLLDSIRAEADAKDSPGLSSCTDLHLVYLPYCLGVQKERKRLTKCITPQFGNRAD